MPCGFSVRLLVTCTLAAACFLCLQIHVVTRTAARMLHNDTSSFPNPPELPEEADVRLSRTNALPLPAGRGGLWPSVLASQAAHAPSSWRLRSASPADFARWLTVRLRGRWGLSTSASPPPDAPRGLRARRDHVHQHRLQWAL